MRPTRYCRSVSDDDVWSTVTGGEVIELDGGLEAPVLATRLLLGVRSANRCLPLDVRLGNHPRDQCVVDAPRRQHRPVGHRGIWRRACGSVNKTVPICFR